MSFTQKDIEQIKNKGLIIKKVEEQLQLFKTGIPFINLKETATIGNGILRCNTDETNEFISYYNTKKENLSTLKFVPASGEATRMFKFLFDFIKEYNEDSESLKTYIH